MKNLYTKISATVLLLLFFVPMMSMQAAAKEPYQQTVGKATVYMHDLADLMTDEQEAELIQSVKKHTQKLNYHILFLTTSDAQGKNTMTYSDDYMDRMFANHNNAIAFVIDMDNHKIYVNTMGDAIKYLDDSSVRKTMDKGSAKIKKGDYEGTLEAMSDYALGKISVKDPNGRTLMKAFAKGIGAVQIPSIVIAILVGVGLVFQHKKANKAPAATVYIDHGSYDINNKDTRFIRTYNTVQSGYYKQSSSGSGSSGGSSHRSSSGNTHGGGGRSF